MGSVEQAAAAARPFALPSSTRHFEPDRPFVVEHMVLEIALEVAHKSIRATATVDARRVDAAAPALVLDAVGFDVRGVTIDGRPAAYSYDGRSISVPVDLGREKVRVTVSYRATPRRGLYFLEPDEHVPSRPRQVWSQCQEEDARHFVPCHDSPHVKMTTDVTVHVPAGWYALSNGALVSADKAKADSWSYRWKMSDPTPSYLLTIAAGEFAEIAETVRVADRDVPVSYLFPKGREADAKRAFASTPEMIRHFSELTGVPYPWNKYAQVVVADFIFGGMENTTATTLYEHVLIDERASIDISSDDLVAHELAHQWFGDYVTCRAWYEGWLNEGFATFCEHVWRDKKLGRDEYAYGLKADLEAYLGEARGRYRRPIVCQDYDSPLDLFDRHLYEKGGLVLHSLRTELGDGPFWAAVRLYLQRHAHGVVETRDLQRAMEEASGRGLGRFFDQWVYKAGHPEMDVEVSWEGGVLTVLTRQTQATGDGVPAHFDLPLDLDVIAGSEAVERRALRVTEKQHSFAVPVPVRPAFVVIDPDMRVVGEVRVKAPCDMLRAQLRSAVTGRGRWLAAQAMARFDDPATIAALAEALDDGREFWGVRAECAAALGKIRGEESFAALTRGRDAAHPKVRRAAVDALGQFRTTEAAEAIKPRALRDESYLVEGEAAKALGRTRQPAVFDVLVDLLERASWFDVVRAGAIDGLAALRDDRAVPHLAARVRYGHPQRARRAAILSLPKLASDRKTRENLEQLLDDPDPLLRIDVVRALGDLGDVKARPALHERLEVDLDARVRRRIREVIRDLAEPRRGAEQLRDEIEKLRADHAELKARLAKVEARLGGPVDNGLEPPLHRATPKSARARSAKGKKR